jgi:hypothetical protein
MFIFPSMLIPAASAAGMKTPGDADNYDPTEYPHFFVFCKLQLGKRMHNLGEHWEHAKIVAAVSDEHICTITLAEMIALGFDF